MSEMEDLKNKLFRSKKTGWESVDDDRRNEINKFCDEYMYFLNNSIFYYLLSSHYNL